MTTPDLMWWLLVLVGPLPLVWVYLRVRAWRQARRDAREVRDFMAKRRARFGGSIRPPGSRGVVPLDRPER